MDELAEAQDAVAVAAAVVKQIGAAAQATQDKLTPYTHEHAALTKERRSRIAQLARATSRLEATEERLVELAQITAPILVELKTILTDLAAAKNERQRLDTIERVTWRRLHPAEPAAAGMLGSREMEYDQ